MQYEYKYHIDDIPGNLNLKGDLAIDTEAMGLNNHRDRLCVLQLADELNDIHLVHFKNRNYNAPNLKKLLTDKARVKIFHYARFDVAIIQRYLEIDIDNIFCTKIASKLSRTYTHHHSLLELCNELLDVKISKQQQSSDWGGKLSEDQKEYAATDVLHLHKIKKKLDSILERENRIKIANACFEFISHRTDLDLYGWQDVDIFKH